MVVSSKILKLGLESIILSHIEYFGFKKFFFVFSGRRGIHCWVCDKGAMELTDEQRSAIVNFLTVRIVKNKFCDSQMMVDILI